MSALDHYPAVIQRLALTQIFLPQVVDSVYDCKSEVIGPGFFRFKAEIGKDPLDVV